MNTLIQLSYLVASVLFIIGIKMMNKTKEARNGNFLSAVGMLIAIVATVLQIDLITLPEIIACVVVGSAIGWYYAKTVEMTGIPEMVALFNGFGGLASVGVALSDYFFRMGKNEPPDSIIAISILASLLIGGVTFTGSMVAYGKLSGKVTGSPVTFKGQHPLNLVLLLAFIGLSVLLFLNPTNDFYIWAVTIIGLLLGILTVIPIGGADMPVVISLLNSYSGMAACATGFILNNNVLIVAGSLVGASGIILTQIMCKAMNRSLTNVLLGGFGQTASTAGPQDGPQIVIKEVGVEEAAMLFDSASSVIVVPGYGMAVAQAQHVIRELMEQCEKRNISFKFAIHPVAGRMPGHMNVLLAEANISYDKLIEMEQIKDEFANTDLVFVVGANDVVNPAARTNPQSPIYGMPILNADKAKTVIVSKRSMGKGYAGIENELFGYPNCLMLFGDAKQTITKVVNEMKEL